MLYTLAVLAMTAVVAPAPSQEPPHRTLVVNLIHRCRPRTECLPNRILASMRQEAEGVWSPLDVGLDWIDSGQTAATSHPAGLTVVLEEGAYAPSARDRGFVLAALTQPSAACGWGVAHVWVRQIERYTAWALGAERASASRPAVLAGTFLGRALGRALAHEIGHYLLGTGAHTTHGLMRSQFKPEDLLEAPVSQLYGLDSRERAGLLSCRTRQETDVDGAR